MSNKDQQLMAQLVAAVYHSPGVTDQSLRKAIKTAVASGGDQFKYNNGAIPKDLRPYLYKVGRHAYKVTDDDLDTLKARGYSEDALFELTVSAAVGAGLGRLDRGLAALNGRR